MHMDARKTELKTSPIARQLEYSIMQRDEIYDTQDMLSFWIKDFSFVSILYI